MALYFCNALCDDDDDDDIDSAKLVNANMRTLPKQTYVT